MCSSDLPHLNDDAFVAVLRDERVIVEMRIRRVDPIDLRELAGAKGFVGVEAPSALQKALAAKNLVDARNATGEAVGSVENRGVDIGDLDAAAQQIYLLKRSPHDALAAVQERIDARLRRYQEHADREPH